MEKLQDNYETVFATQFINPFLDSQYSRWLNWKRFLPDSEDIELAFKLKDSGQLIKKNTYTCVNNIFLEHLAKLSIDEVHICGIDTDICVMTCAVGLFDDGRFRPVVLSKYSASHAGKKYHNMGLELLKRYIGEKEIK